MTADVHTRIAHEELDAHEKPGRGSAHAPRAEAGATRLEMADSVSAYAEKDAAYEAAKDAAAYRVAQSPEYKAAESAAYSAAERLVEVRACKSSACVCGCLRRTWVR